jgi:hypothetical protein
MALKQLGQTRPPTLDTFVSIYSPGSNIEASSLVLTIANVTGTDSTYRICQDDDGTTYDQSTALAWDVAIAANTVARINVGPMNNSAGNLAVASDLGNANTFTLHGVERLFA